MVEMSMFPSLSHRTVTLELKMIKERAVVYFWNDRLEELCRERIREVAERKSRRGGSGVSECDGKSVLAVGRVYDLLALVVANPLDLARATATREMGSKRRE